MTPSLRRVNRYPHAAVGAVDFREEVRETVRGEMAPAQPAQAQPPVSNFPEKWISPILTYVCNVMCPLCQRENLS